MIKLDQIYSPRRVSLFNNLQIQKVLDKPKGRIRETAKCLQEPTCQNVRSSASYRRRPSTHQNTLNITSPVDVGASLDFSHLNTQQDLPRPSSQEFTNMKQLFRMQIQEGRAKQPRLQSKINYNFYITATNPSNLFHVQKFPIINLSKKCAPNTNPNLLLSKIIHSKQAQESLREKDSIKERPPTNSINIRLFQIPICKQQVSHFARPAIILRRHNFFIRRSSDRRAGGGGGCISILL